MLNVNHLIGFGAGGPNGSIINRIRGLGLASDLALCLDAGDINSWPGSGQKWLDVSGGGYDFYRGAGSGSEGSDPTFNGTPGGQSSNEYWSFDGGDYFTYDSANETWMNNLHKAGAQFTIISWWNFAIGSGAVGLAATEGANDSKIGFADWKNAVSGGSRVFQIKNGSGTSYLSAGMGAMPSNAIICLGVSYDQTILSVTSMLNGSFSSPTPTINGSPSSSNASYTMQIGAFGNGTLPQVSGTRIYNFAMWTRALSQGELGAFFENSRGIFGV